MEWTPAGRSPKLSAVMKARSDDSIRTPGGSRIGGGALAPGPSHHPLRRAEFESAFRRVFQGVAFATGLAWAATAEENVYLAGVPDYEWYSGCFGTACGNLIGFWDRHGFPDFYRGPTAGGTAPLDSFGAHYGIRSLWVSAAGRDGRPASQPGHEEDYYVAYDSAAQDPYKAAGRPEHTPDCIGDFIGLNQRKWTNMAGECDGNIDGYAFAYWDATGSRRTNYRPGPEAGRPPRDLQSGLQDWSRYCGYDAEVFTQLSDFNPKITGPGPGFSFADVRAEIDAGYPLLAFLQNWNQSSRPEGEMARANPEIHGMLIYGYFVDDSGTERVRVRTSWATGDYEFREWNAASWTPSLGIFLPLRGVIGFRPAPKIVSATPGDHGGFHLRWHGPAAELHDAATGNTRPVHAYVVEMADSLAPTNFQPVSPVLTGQEWTVPNCCPGTAFYRVKLVPAPQ
jgi:hypothetical protein